MRDGAILLAAIVLGCASPEAAFVGAYEGIQDCAGRDLDTGESYSDPAAAITVVIDRDVDTGAPFISGRGCNIWLDARSTEMANIIPTVCNVTLEDGTPVRASYESGAVRLIDGDELRVVYSMLAELPSRRLSLNYEIDAVRSER